MFPSRSSRAQSAIVAFVAMSSGAILVLSGALEDSPRVNIDPVTESTVVANPVPRPETQVMLTYLGAFDTWSACEKNQPAVPAADVASSPCGTMPAQPDDPQLNAYLAEVLDWNKCAAPRLKHGGVEQAEIACGAQPLSPLGN